MTNIIPLTLRQRGRTSFSSQTSGNTSPTASLPSPTSSTSDETTFSFDDSVAAPKRKDSYVDAPNDIEAGVADSDASLDAEATEADHPHFKTLFARGQGIVLIIMSILSLIGSITLIWALIFCLSILHTVLGYHNQARQDREWARRDEREREKDRENEDWKATVGATVKSMAKEIKLLQNELLRGQSENRSARQPPSTETTKDTDQEQQDNTDNV